MVTLIINQLTIVFIGSNTFLSIISFVDRDEVDSEIIYSFIFYKAKYDSYGEFIKLKANRIIEPLM